MCVLVLFDSTKLKLRLVDCGLGGLRGGVSLRTFARTLPRPLLPVFPGIPRPLFRLALSNSGMVLASPRSALAPASLLTVSVRAMLRKGERGDRGSLMDRTALRLRLRLHQRHIAVRMAARKTREPRVMPAMAPPERGQREREEGFEGFEGRLVEDWSVGDAVRDKVALTSAVYGSL